MYKSKSTTPGCWHLSMYSGELRVDDLPLVPIWANRPDLLQGMQALDEWADATGLLDSLPQIAGWNTWWYQRFIIVHDVLFRTLPYARALRELERNIGTPRQIVAEHLSDIWWEPLLKCLFPKATIRVQPPKSVMLGRIKRISARTLRAMVTSYRLNRLSLQDSSRTRIIIVTQSRYWTGEKDTQFQNVIECLTGQGMEVVVWVQSHSKEADKLHGLKTRPKDHLFGDVVYWKAFRNQCRVHAPSIQVPESPLIIDGIDFAPMVCSVVKHTFKLAFQEQGVWIAGMPQVLKMLRPAAVILLDETGAEHFLHKACKMAGVPTIALQHGCIHASHLHYIFPKGVMPDQVPLANRTCVYGTHYKALLVQKSIYPADTVEVTGAPEKLLAPCAETMRSAKGEAFRISVLPPNSKFLLLVTSQDLLHEFIGPRIMREMARSKSSLFMIVRPHPRETHIRNWEKLIDKYYMRKHVLVLQSPDLETMLDACDVHISSTSTTLGEAALIGRPSIVIGGKLFGDWMGVLSAGVAVDLDEFPSLEVAARHWLHASSQAQRKFFENREQYIRAHFPWVGMEAAERVVAALKDVIQE